MVNVKVFLRQRIFQGFEHNFTENLFIRISSVALFLGNRDLEIAAGWCSVKIAFL